MLPGPGHTLTQPGWSERSHAHTSYPSLTCFLFLPHTPRSGSYWTVTNKLCQTSPPYLGDWLNDLSITQPLLYSPSTDRVTHSAAQPICWDQCHHCFHLPLHPVLYAFSGLSALYFLSLHSFQASWSLVLIFMFLVLFLRLGRWLPETSRLFGFMNMWDVSELLCEHSVWLNWFSHFSYPPFLLIPCWPQTSALNLTRYFEGQVWVEEKEGWEEERSGKIKSGWRAEREFGEGGEKVERNKDEAMKKDNKDWWGLKEEKNKQKPRFCRQIGLKIALIGMRWRESLATLLETC